MHILKTEQIKHSANQMYQLVNDISSYPEFIPWCSKAIILDGEPDSWMLAKLTFEFHGISQSFTTRNNLINQNTIEIKLVNGPFDHLEGIWRFSDTALGSEICLDLEYQFTSSWLSSVFEPAFRQVSEMLVDSFKNRAQEIYG